MKEQEILNKVENAVKKSNGKVTTADISAATGYSLDETEDALKRLMEIYFCRISLNSETGEIQYIFDYPLKKRGSKSFKEISYTVLKAFWSVFKIIYKASIAVILILYTIVFALILIFALSRGNSSDNNKGGGRIIGGLFRAVFEAMYLISFTRQIEYSTDKYGYNYKKYKEDDNKGKKFIHSVFHFVFGPDRPIFDPLEDDKEIIAYLRENDFKLTSAKIIELSGSDYEEADNKLTKYISKYDGEPHITTESVLEVDFPRLENRKAAELDGGNIIYYKDEIEPPYEVTGNSTGRNSNIILLNSFNLIMSLFILNYLSINLDINALNIALGYFPLVFSILFFLIPILRIPYINKKKNERNKDIIRKKLIEVIIAAQPNELNQTEIYRYAEIDDNESDTAKKVLEKLVIELEGEININERNEAIYSFPRLYRELKAL
jgi:hypothetical protein